MIAGNGPSIRELSNHSVKVNLRAAEHHEHIAGVVARIFEPETDHRCLPILLLQRLKLKSSRVRYVRLRVVRYSLFVRHLCALCASLWLNFLGRLVGLEPTTS